METPQNKNNIVTIARLCLVLSFVSTFITVAFSYSLLKAHLDNGHLTKFLSNASTIQSDFEQSLIMYTENTKSAMEFVDTLQPDNETKYIGFISKVEDLGQSLGIDLTLESLSSSKGALHFLATFYGSKSRLIDFLTGLENLPYYVRIENLSYSDLSIYATERDTIPPNIAINFLLYVK
ncbi:MAG: hypothetical protein WC897_02370 [Candidatus Gracilibacteria bacterium]